MIQNKTGIQIGLSTQTQLHEITLSNFNTMKTRARSPKNPISEEEEIFPLFLYF